MSRNKKLGELLKEAGLIDDFQLQSALSHQRNWGGKLGSVLVEMEFVKETDLARVIAEKMGIPYVDLFEPEISAPVLKLLRTDIAKKYNVVPVKKEQGGLVMAMSDPLDINVLDALRFATGFTIKPALALESEIRDAIRKYYDGQAVDRKRSVSFREIAKNSSGAMEFVRGSRAEDNKISPGAGAIPKKEESGDTALQEYKIRIDALTSLLIEKSVITREELVKMIYQKKMGL